MHTNPVGTSGSLLWWPESTQLILGRPGLCIQILRSDSGWSAAQDHPSWPENKLALQTRPQAPRAKGTHCRGTKEPWSWEGSPAHKGSGRIPLCQLEASQHLVATTIPMKTRTVFLRFLTIHPVNCIVCIESMHTFVIDVHEILLYINSMTWCTWCCLGVNFF